MVKSEERHCNDAQNTKWPQCGCSTSWKMTRFYAPNDQLAAARCCWIALYNWFSQFLYRLLDDVCSVALAHKPPKNRCSRWRTDGKPLVGIATVPLRLAENAYRQRPLQFHDYQHQSLTRPIVCLLWSQQRTTSHRAESSTDLVFLGDFNGLWRLVKFLIDIHL